jgi:hypothetical protein
MAEAEKIYSPAVIEDAPFPTDDAGAPLTVTQESSNQIFGAQKINDQKMPIKRVAQELISTSLNSKSRKILAEFSFTEGGAIQVGKYENGVSGDLRITPNGIVARDLAGITTFAIDGTTGSAVFKGSVQAGSVITGEVIVGNNNVIIDGENRRILINDGDVDRILIGFQENGF